MCFCGVYVSTPLRLITSGLFEFWWKGDWCKHTTFDHVYWGKPMSSSLVCQVDKQGKKKAFWGSTKYTERTETVLTCSALSLKVGLWHFQTARTTELGFWRFEKGELTWPEKVLKDNHEIIVTSFDVFKCLNKYVYKDAAFIHHSGYSVENGKRLTVRRVWSRFKT